MGKGNGGKTEVIHVGQGNGSDGYYWSYPDFGPVVLGVKETERFQRAAVHIDCIRALIYQPQASGIPSDSMSWTRGDRHAPPSFAARIYPQHLQKLLPTFLLVIPSLPNTESVPARTPPRPPCAGRRLMPKERWSRIPMNADIVAICVKTGVRYHTATDIARHFLMNLLPPGDYSARAEAEGMSPQISPTLHVEVGASTGLNFKLGVAGPKETVTVSEAPHRVETSPSAVSTLLDEAAIANVPLNGRRFTDLLLLTPGVTQAPRGLTSGSNGDLSYEGIRGYHTSYIVDGADNNNGFFGRLGGATVRLTSFRMKSCRNSGCLRIVMAQNLGGQGARSSM
jgi:hypothetical protein